MLELNPADDYTRNVAAEYMLRYLLGLRHNDEAAQDAAVEDAAAAGVKLNTLLAVTGQMLVLYWEAADPDWQDKVRADLLAAELDD